MRLPNMRVQRTRSSPSAPHSPLTRRPLGAAGTLGGSSVSASSRGNALVYEHFRRYVLLVTFPVSFAALGVVLLLFHIVCSPLHDPVEGTLPYARTAQVLRFPVESVEIDIGHDGSIDLLGKSVTLRELANRLIHGSEQAI